MTLLAEVSLITPGPEAAEALASIHAETFDRPWSADELASLAGAAGVVVLAAQSRDLLGFVMIRRQADEAEILTLAVRPGAQRRGIGAALLQAALGVARAGAAATVWLEVADDNLAALALYRSAGFQTAGRRLHYYPQPGAEAKDALVMRALLNSVAS